MRLLNIMHFNAVGLFKNTLLIVIGIFYGLLITQATYDEKWIYFGVLLLPLLVYVSIKKPFLFPFGAYVFLLPFDSISSITGSTKVVTLTRILGILTILILFLKGTFENKLKRPDAVTIWWILFMLYGVLSILWAVKPEYVIGRIQTAVGLLLLYLIIASYKFQKDEYEIIKYCILIGAFIAATISIYAFTSGFFHQRASLSFGGMEANPNGLAFSLLLPISICLEQIMKKNNKTIRSIFAFILTVIIFCVIITGSRANMIAVGIIFIIYISFTRRRIALAITLIIIGMILIQLIPDVFYERWGKVIETGGSGRLDIWYVAWKTLEKYWLIGAGLSNFPEAYTEYASYAPNFAGINRASHNIYIGTFVELGIIGFILLILAIWKHYRLLQSRFIQRDISQIMLKAAFWAILLSSSFNDRVWDKRFWLLWMMILMYSNVSRRETLLQKKIFHIYKKSNNHAIH